MVLGWSLRRAVVAAVAAALCAGLLGFWIIDEADAGLARCERHRTQAAERAAIVQGHGERVVVIGDSWAVGLGLDDLADSWPSRLEGEVHVAGFSGSGFAAQSSSCGRHSFADRARAAIGDADVVVVEGGLNDVHQTNAAIDAGFRRLMRGLDGRRVVIIGPASAPRRAARVGRVDTLLSELSNDYGVPYVSTLDLELDYLDDDLHLTAAGHAAFGAEVGVRLAGLTPVEPRH